MHFMPGLRRGLLAGTVAVTAGGCFLWASVAFAADGVVTVLESEAHSAPFQVAPVVRRLRIGDRVSADEHSADGWRRVRLTDGTFAYVPEAEVQIVPPAPAAAAPAAAGSPATAGTPVAPPAPATLPLRATVKVLELTARAAPSFDAPVLQVLAQGTELAVSGGVTNGWREAVLGDGRKAYVADPGLEIRAATTGAATLGAPARPASIALTPRIYVKDVDHLAELVRDDTVVSPMAESLVTRRNAAIGAMVTGAGVGLLLIILSATSLKTTKLPRRRPSVLHHRAERGAVCGRSRAHRPRESRGSARLSQAERPSRPRQQLECAPRRQPVQHRVARAGRRRPLIVRVG